MVEFAAGAPCWADVMLPDLEAGKRFYGPLLGWTFGKPDPDRHRYTLTYRDDKAVGALVAKPDGRMPTVWNVYFASPDARATARAIHEAGGQVFAGPEQVGPFGTMVMAADPVGGVFGVWEGARRPGFSLKDSPGSFCWTELTTRDPETADPFYRAVFGYRTEQIGRAGGAFDYEVWTLPDGPDGAYAGGRLRMDPQAPAALPAHFTVLLGVEDCDEAADQVLGLGGKVRTPPRTSPYGRLAEVTDNQGARFTVIDLSRTAEG
ncbi:VOC family protein [Streptantibioticus silvisoli]|uniref:VOC family protein n=1 Tax=Streptantibioticus silvisoli TaxID=2705255 RepID=A0ABT6W616_9ACTN|nr:VOC family protein [Streptantibioticus silvisoli]MDI5965088.1 VOC family protein [Streptantibioticus silvisoli]